MLLAVLCLASCGGTPDSKTAGDSNSICKCLQTEPDSTDYRHAAKHVPLPNGTAQSITVATMLGWPVPTQPAADAARSGRENQLFQIDHAYLQFAGENTGDCDLHLEVADTTDKNAPRVIVETPKDDSYCPSRMALAAALAPSGVTLGPGSGELSPAVPVTVTGLAFEDFNHKRGTDKVKTVWELHPAVVTVLSK